MEGNLIGTVLYCHTWYHRGPYFYYIVRESKACVWVKTCKTNVENSHGDGTYHSETVVGVEAGDGEKEYRLYKRYFKDDQTKFKEAYIESFGRLYFVGTVTPPKPDNFYIWDGTPMERNDYY